MLNLDSTADTAGPSRIACQDQLATAMCTSAAIMVTAAVLGPGTPAVSGRVPVVFNVIFSASKPVWRSGG